MKVSKIFSLIGSFWAKYILLELKEYRWVIFHETEEGYKIRRGINLSFQNWQKEFDKFWPERLKVWKIFTLMGSFWVKYILFELKTYRGVIFHETEDRYIIWRGIDLSFQIWHNEFDKFWRELLKVSKVSTLKRLRQLVWRLLLRSKNVPDWKKCPISMFSEIFSRYKHALTALFRK